MGMGLLGGFDHLLRAWRRAAVADVVEHRVVEQHRLLRDHADLPPQVAQPHIAQIDAVEPHRAAAWDRRTAGPGWPASFCRSRWARRSPAFRRTESAGRCRPTPAGRAGRRSECPSNVNSRRCRAQRHRLDRIANRRLAVEQLIDAVGGGGAPLQAIEHFRHLSGRIAGADQHAVKHQQAGQVQRPVAHLDAQQSRLLVQHQIGAAENAQANHRHAHHFDHRMAQGVVARDFHRLAIDLLAVFVQPAAFVAFHRERLHDLDAAERFLQDRIEVRHFLHGAAVGPLERLWKAG